MAKRDTDLSAPELAAWLARWLHWRPSWDQYQEWTQTAVKWRAGTVQAENQRLLESRKRGAA